MALDFSQVAKIEIPKYQYYQLDSIKFNGTDNYVYTNGGMISPGYTQETILEFSLSDISEGYVIGGYNAHEYFYVYANNGILTIKWRAAYYDSQAQIWILYDEYNQAMSSISAGTKYYFRFLQSSSTYNIQLKQGSTSLFTDTVDYSDYPFPANVNVAFMARRSSSATYDGFAEGIIYNWQGGGGTAATRKTYTPFLNNENKKIGFIRADAVEDAVPFYLQGTVNMSSRGDRVKPQTLVIPTIEVNKIEDSNNVMIWGSYSAFPYRKLEYIQFSGAEYLAPDLYGSSGKWWKIEASFDTYGTTNDLFCSYRSGVATARQRFYIGRSNSSSKMQFALGNTWSDAISITTGDKISFACRTVQSSNNTRLYFNVNDLDTSTQLINSSVVSATGTTDSNGCDLYLMANHNYGSGAERFATGKVYSLIQRNDSSSGTIEFNGIPCQRKSDGVCGLYDVANGVFKPMSGTAITSTAAGPVVDEYWDLTA